MKLASIQMLRALAAIMVVYTHSICSMGSFGRGWLQRLPASTALGTLGVDIFFVISGFVIFRSAGRLTGSPDALSFLWHRFRRINPVYYAATLLTLLIWLPGILRGKHPEVNSRTLLTSFLLCRYPGWANPILVQAWTLFYEWYFYLIFCLLILVGVKRKVGMLAILLGSLVFLGWTLRDHPIDVLDFYTDPYIIEFLLGVGIGYCFQRWTPGRTVASALLLPGILLAVICIWTGYADIAGRVYWHAPIYHYHHAFGWGSAAALIVAGCVFLEKNGTFTFFHRNRLIALLGDASYSIYLFHFIVLGAMATIYLRVGFFLTPDLAINMHVILMVAGSLLFYKWVELPLLKAFRKKRSPRPIPTPPVVP
jgi:exopolysaccharide production protein ExoZ